MVVSPELISQCYSELHPLCSAYPPLSATYTYCVQVTWLQRWTNEFELILSHQERNEPGPRDNCILREKPVSLACKR